MKERPILFSAPMVRAILSGAKTQTRRIVKGVKPVTLASGEAVDCIEDVDGLPSRLDWAVKDWSLCPYGVPGDRLWVRETWRAIERDSDMIDGIQFRADDAFEPIGNTIEASERWVGVYERDRRWKPSIHMPRWASRITLEVTGVRVERLCDISEEDARAEGVEDAPPVVVCACEGPADDPGPTHRHDCTWRDPTYDPCGIRAVDEYAILWNAINGAGAWNLNPWVWAISFRRVQP